MVKSSSAIKKIVLTSETQFPTPQAVGRLFLKIGDKQAQIASSPGGIYVTYERKAQSESFLEDATKESCVIANAANGK